MFMQYVYLKISFLFEEVHNSSGYFAEELLAKIKLLAWTTIFFELCDVKKRMLPKYKQHHYSAYLAKSYVENDRFHLGLPPVHISLYSLLSHSLDCGFFNLD